ncbi:GNAT family N-acetyltransferase [Cellulomonas palmilytica]|uniref:GNAT family N-acetyltransferase n=1 Tax=Cellulomonas palmilytica TaxID=2608402 RepID=UPI001F353DE4|nr:GNAT family N-acetyltransferase [Cellulomonas palmilytica]UJP41357.1 GNAT family N-acetyltransferase [Cellulomonas palmilytica]
MSARDVGAAAQVDPALVPGVETEMATWPPVRLVVTGQGWRAGLSGGLTRRANSAVALVAPPAGVAAAVDEVEAVYADAGLPAVMRVGRAGLQDEVRAELDGRGWVERSLAHVLARDLAGLPGTASTGPARTVVAHDPDDAWLDLHLDVKTGGAANPDDRRRATARAILTGGDAWHLAAYDGDALVGIIRVARAGRWGALSCLAVRPEHRRRGLGRLLTLRALEVAREHGASHAFLQVEAHNAGAAALYGDLGFDQVDVYSYLERPARDGSSTGGGC